MVTPTAVDRRHASRRIVAACLSGFLGVASGACLAAESPQVNPANPRTAESAQVTPAITLRSTLTDNVNLAPSDRRQSDLVIEVAPSVRVNTDTARLKLRLFYQLDGLIDSRESSRSEIRNQLDATGTVQAIENFLFVDLRGNVQQVAISPFGARPPSNANFTDNRTESRTFLISPYVRGRIVNLADYTLRYSETFPDPAQGSTTRGSTSFPVA
ncbi:MAG: TIGR03016 family PEP-CTERM system-associated outer membrane protein [Betaproteobacteria bacterium]